MSRRSVINARESAAKARPVVGCVNGCGCSGSRPASVGSARHRASWARPGRQARIGASIWQTPGGVQSELEKINGDFNVFLEEVKSFVLAHGYPGAVEPRWQSLAQLYAGVVIPLVREWQAFYQANKGWLDNVMWNHAPEAEQFQQQLIDVRGKARAAGMEVMSPDPVTFAPSILFDPHHNVVDAAAQKAKDAADDLMRIAKIALYAALGVGGLVLFSTLSNRARSY